MKKMNNSEFVNRIKKISNNKYTVLGQYVNAHTPVRIKCNICANIWSPRPCNLLYNNSGCPECRRNKLKRSQDEFIKLIFEETNNEYEVLSEYKRSDIKVKMKHKKCGYQWDVLPNNFLTGSRCPKCNLLPEIENKIKEIFESKDYQVELFYSFENCRAKTELKFDLNIKNKNNNLIIELDDIRHFQANYKKNLEEDIKDKIKNNYCLRNNIRFLRVPYWRYKILIDVLSNKLRPNMIISEIEKLIIDNVVQYKYWLDSFIQDVEYKNCLIDNDFNSLQEIAHKTIERINKEKRTRPDKLKNICEIQQKYKVSKDYIYRLINNYYDSTINLIERSRFNIWLIKDSEFKKMKRKKEEDSELKDTVKTTLYINKDLKHKVDSKLALKGQNFSKATRKLLKKYATNNFDFTTEKEIHNIISKDIKSDCKKDKKTTINLTKDLKKTVENKLKNRFKRKGLLSALIQTLCIKKFD